MISALLAAAEAVAGRTASLAENEHLDPRLLWAALALVGALLLGALLIWWVDRWRKQPPETQGARGDQLALFRKLFDRGELSPEEFERIRGKLRERLREEWDVPPRDQPPDSPPAP